MNNRQIKSIETKLIKEQKKIAANRDKLRELIEEWEYLKEDCTQACDDIGYAIEALSRLQ